MHITEAMLIDTQRLRLRPIKVEDAEQIHQLWTEPAMLRTLWAQPEVSFDQSRALIEKNVELFENGTAGLWCAFAKDEDLVVGFCGFWRFEAPPDPQLLVGISRGLSGRGLGTEIAGAVLHYGFEHLGFDRVVVEIPNRRARRMMEKLGFKAYSDPEVSGLALPYYATERDSPRTTPLPYLLVRSPQALLRV